MNAPRSRRALGDAAEELVVQFLRRQGLSILHRNVRLGYLELDIVARQESVLVIVEVRRRGRGARTTGFSSIDGTKRKRLRFAAERLWKRRYKFDSSITRIRFDVASVSYDGPRPVIEYARAAF